MSQGIAIGNTEGGQLIDIDITVTAATFPDLGIHIKILIGSLNGIFAEFKYLVKQRIGGVQVRICFVKFLPQSNGFDHISSDGKGAVPDLDIAEISHTPMLDYLRTILQCPGFLIVCTGAGGPLYSIFTFQFLTVKERQGRTCGCTSTFRKNQPNATDHFLFQLDKVVAASFIYQLFHGHCKFLSILHPGG